MMKYLEADVNLLGRNSGPLHMRNDVKEENARFTLHSRLYRRKAAPADLRGWVCGKDRFFINCSRRAYRIDGFLAMKRALRGGGTQAEFSSICVSSVKHHNEINHVFMLFSLISPKERDILSPNVALSPEHTEFDQFVQKQGASGGQEENLDRKLDDQFDVFVGEGSQVKFEGCACAWKTWS